MFDIKAPLGTKIKSRMNELGIKQVDLARRSGLKQSHISELISGERGKRPSFETMRKLARGLRVRVTFFSSQIVHMHDSATQNGNAK